MSVNDVLKATLSFYCDCLLLKGILSQIFLSLPTSTPCSMWKRTSSDRDADFLCFGFMKNLDRLCMIYV